VGEFNTPLSLMGRSSRQKINKDLNDTTDQMDLTDNRIFHPAIAQYTFLPAAYRTFSKIDHVLGYKSILNKFKKLK
jgi:hypothetical protein